MTKDQKHAALTRWLETYQHVSEPMDVLYKLTGSTADSPLQNPVWQMFDAYTATLGTLVGDQGDWLAWFIYENGCGEKSLEVSIRKKRRKIRTIKDLLWVLETHAN